MPISPSISTLAPIPRRVAPSNSEELYLDLLKRALTRALMGKKRERQTLKARAPVKRQLIALLQKALEAVDLELVRVIRCSAEDYLESGDEATNRAEDAETMIGLNQLDSMQQCIADVIRNGVPGDLLEAGVWRGGMTIFMRGALEALGDTGRHVWVADSFEGLPSPDRAVERFGWWWRPGDMAVTLDSVRENFARYGLLDHRVKFLKGYFDATLPTAQVTELAVLRIDADLYSSTVTVLNALYPKLSRGGFCVVDDYQNLQDCRRAVDEYREAHDIVDAIIPIDRRAVYWKRG